MPGLLPLGKVAGMGSKRHSKRDRAKSGKSVLTNSVLDAVGGARPIRVVSLVLRRPSSLDRGVGARVRTSSE